jgi:thermitase
MFMRFCFGILVLFVMNITVAQDVKQDRLSTELKAVQITNGNEATLRKLLKRMGRDSIEVINSLRGDSVKYALIPITELSAQQLAELERDISAAERRLTKKKTGVVEISIVQEGDMSSLKTDEFIIRFRDAVSTETMERFFVEKQIDVLRRSAYDDHEYLIAFRKVLQGVKPELLIQRDTTLVEYVTPNVTTLKPKSSLQHREPTPVPNMPFGAPNDALVKFQWHIFDIAMLATDTADRSCCEISKKGAEVIVAVLDEGVDILHPDLKDNIINPFDILYNRSMQQPGSDEIHGTACAGIIAATSNNTIGVSGVACNARIMPIRIWNSSLNSVFNAVEGIRRAMRHGARVINCSWELRTTSEQEQKPVNRVIDEAIRNNCVLVFAAGNSGAGVVAYPGSLAFEKDIITVAATTRARRIKVLDPAVPDDWGSQFGKGITVGAPGVEIYTTVNSINNDPRYDLFDGTSSATPIVSGAIALMLSVRPELTPAEVKAIISMSCDADGDVNKDSILGYGLINIKKLVRNASEFKRIE